MKIAGNWQRRKTYKICSGADKLKEYDIVYAPVGARDEELLIKGKDADFILVDAIGSISGNVIRQMANLKLIHSEGGRLSRCGS